MSGDELTNRAVEQAWLFGAEFVVTQEAVALETRGRDRLVRTRDGSEVLVRSVVVATGVAWRRLGLPSLEALVGAGVFYGAAGAEARAMRGCDTFVVGAGNSAGQAALHLARYAASVTLVVRGDSLATSMSEYLITEIENSPVITVRVHTQVVDGQGHGRLEALTLLDRTTGEAEEVPATALFVMIGAEPRTDWLGEAVARDARGYLLTGNDVAVAVNGAHAWPLQRPPLLLETSMPGVFAAGDVRSGSVKRVAAAVGAGAIAIQLVHEYLADTLAVAPNQQAGRAT